MDGNPVGARRKPVRTHLLRDDAAGRRLLPAGLPWLGGHALVLRERAYLAVGEVLRDAGEFLELHLADGSDRLWLFKVCHVVDALDEGSSEIVRFPSTGRVMRVARHVFDPVRVRGLAAFRVPQVRTLFLWQQPVDASNAARLRGASFELAWESREG